jgi:small-conductance mechanosensitive channel
VPSTPLPEVEEYAPAFVQSAFPLLARVSFLDIALWQWVGVILALAVALLSGFVLALLFSSVVNHLGRGGNPPWRVRVVDRSRAPIAVLLALGVFEQLLDQLHLVGSLSVRLTFAAHLVTITAFAWLALRAIRAVIDGVEEGLPVGDEVRDRGLRTQLVLLNRIASALIVVIATAVLLSQFDAVRQLGVSLLASAGIAGVVFGFAAQRTLGTMLQGIQLSIAQPIRIGDGVFIEGEFGRVEQIHLTYVVLRLWDQRRLIVPIGRFLEQPFQNWTRVNTNLRGAIELFVDYSAPVERVREELLTLTRAEPLWDRDVCSLVVLDSTAAAVKLRAVVSARSPEELFDLRCSLREKMIAFLQKLDDGYHLPVTRSLNLTSSKAMSGNPADTRPLTSPGGGDPPTPTA